MPSLVDGAVMVRFCELGPSWGMLSFDKILTIPYHKQGLQPLKA